MIKWMDGWDEDKRLMKSFEIIKWIRINKFELKDSFLKSGQWEERLTVLTLRIKHITQGLSMVTKLFSDNRDHERVNMVLVKSYTHTAFRETNMW